MSTHTDFLQQAIAMHQQSDQCSSEHDVIAVAVWALLGASSRDTLDALVKRGPLEDGDVPSKVGRTELVRHGLAAKIVVNGRDGFQAATYAGFCVYKAGLAIQSNVREQSP